MSPYDAVAVEECNGISGGLGKSQSLVAGDAGDVLVCAVVDSLVLRKHENNVTKSSASTSKIWF